MVEENFGYDVSPPELTNEDIAPTLREEIKTRSIPPLF